MANNKMNPLSFEEIDQRIAYDPETGRLTWKVTPNRRMKAGDEAGSLKGVRTNTRTGKTNRYRYVRFDGWETPATRVAWLLQTGKWPEGSVILKDGDPGNLRWDNLSEAMFKSVKTTDDNGLRRHKLSKEAQRHYGLKRYYGLTGEDYGRMLAEQGGVCSICSKPEIRLGPDGKPVPLHVDHDHETNEVRSLLCYKCNSALGSMEDNPANLRKAADYIEFHRDRKKAT